MGSTICRAMTTEFNSFDESRLGVFTESHLKARNAIIIPKYYGVVLLLGGPLGPIGPGGKIIRYYAEFPGAAARDTELWNALLTQEPTTAAIVGVLPSAKADAWPNDVSFPRQITFTHIGLGLPSNDVDRLYESIVAHPARKLTRVQIKISSTGDENSAQIQPGITQLFTRLENEGWNFDVQESDFADWLAVLASNLKAQIP